MSSRSPYTATTRTRLSSPPVGSPHRHVSIVLLVALTALSAFAGAASAAPKVTVTTTSYTIWGATEAAIRSSLDRRGPGRFDASTRWAVSYRYRFGVQGGRCVVTSAAVETRIAYLYPRWRVAASAASALRVRWNRHLASLRVHEAGHGRNGRTTGVQAEAALRRVSTSSCATIRQAIVRTVAREIARGQAADRAYDARTGHGASQGARFP